ncbi:MAG: hypothetical protein ACSLE9_04810 [Burkholderiaceae bacterium]
MTDLVFGENGAYIPPAGGSVELIFGNPPGTPGSTVGVYVAGRLRLRGSVAVDQIVIVPVTVAGALRLRGSMAVHVAPIYPVALQGVLRLRGGMAAHYDPGVSGILESRCGVPWRGAAGAGAETVLPWRSGQPAQREIEVSATDGIDLQAETVLPWRPTIGLLAGKVLPWRSGRPIERGVVLPWFYGKPIDTGTVLPWRNGRPVERAIVLQWHGGLPAQRVVALPWRDGRGVDRATVLPWADGRHIDHGVVLPWRGGLPIDTHGSPWSPAEPPPEPPPELNVQLVFCHRLTTSSPNFLFGDPTPCLVFHGPGSTVVVPIRKVYFMINDVHLTREGVEIPTLALQLSLDADSWTWSWSATLPAAELANVAPASDGTPVELVATINGAAYRLLAERIGRTRSFAQATIKVTGRGRNAILDTPYALVQAFGNPGAARTVAQLLDDALTLNGVSIGWGVEFGLDDWLVPAGAWALQGSHIAALTAIAAQAGGYVQPHATADTIRVLHRYPSAPWDWDLVTPDFELPAAVTSVEGIEWVEKPRYNRVFVSGTGQGVLGRITRAGTAGDLVAQMVTDALMTEAAGVTQRGRAILSDTGPQATVSLKLPVLDLTGVIVPGQFVRYVDETALARLGLVRSTSVEVKFPEVWQTIGVETHE